MEGVGVATDPKDWREMKMKGWKCPKCGHQEYEEDKRVREFLKEAGIDIHDPDTKVIFSKQEGVNYLEASAKTRQNVDEGFDQIMKAITRRYEK